MMNTNGVCIVLTIVVCLTLVSAGVSNPPCEGCKRCPMDMPGCCYNETDHAIENHAVISDPSYKCYKKMCKNGHIIEDYNCPPGFVGIGLGCYHVGPFEGTWFEGRDYCKRIGGHLAIVETEEEAEALKGNIDPFLPTGVDNTTTGLVWLGASYQDSNGFVWLNNLPIEDGYSNFPYDYWWYHLWNCLTAYCTEGDAVCYEWFHIYCYASYQPLCEADCGEVQCYYEDQSYPAHAIMWKDPECDCAWIECGEDGEPVAIKKEKPCCRYRDNIYGNGEIVDYSKCYQIKCEMGKLVSYPYCTPDFVPITYAGVASCYHFSEELMDFHEAEKYCEFKDSKLIEISSEEENEALQMYLQLNQLQKGIKQHWLNAEAQLCQGNRLGKLRWMEDLYDIPVEAVYNDFCEGQPVNSSSSRCLMMAHSGEQSSGNYCWANQPCYQHKQAICEKCSKCERSHMPVCYHDNTFIREGTVVSHMPIHNGQCIKTYCSNGRIREIIYPC